LVQKQSQLGLSNAHAAFVLPSISLGFSENDCCHAYENKAVNESIEQDLYVL
jgi:hypothetical protein